MKILMKIFWPMSQSHPITTILLASGALIEPPELPGSDCPSPVEASVPEDAVPVEEVELPMDCKALEKMEQIASKRWKKILIAGI